MNKIFSFCQDVFNIPVHLYFCLNWYVALHLSLSLNHQKDLEFGMPSFIVVVTLFLVLLYLRILDEIKDFAYDQTFNPNRPLVLGKITIKELKVYLGVIGLLTLFINLYSGWMVLSLLSFELLYSTCLIFFEKKSVVIKDNMLVNLLVTYPVNVLLSIYILVIDLTLWKGSALFEDALTILAFACAFLYYEFARKISWPEQEKPGQRSYSAFLGTIPAAIIASLLALTSAVILIYLYHSWVPGFLVLPLGLGLLRLKIRKTMTLSGTFFIGLFYGIVILLGVLDHLDLSFHFLIGP